MAKKNGPSEAFCDKLAETLFHELPSVDGADVNRLYGKIVRLARREASASARAAWDACCEAAAQGAEMAAARGRKKMFDVLLGQANHHN